ncbi:ATP-binding protein [Candidatus Binatus sp.]|uniref:ATP-binding protein n=2 Tax=Candidatus Binatus sp. TaxID=2811406 RepID=UPI003BD9D4AE
MPPETRSAGSIGGSDAPPRVRAVQAGVFRKEGEYWTVGYGGKSFRLKDSKGLGYLAHLLRHPGVEFHVLDLAGGIAGQRDDGETNLSAGSLPRADEDLEKAGIHIGSLGDAGEMLDDQAKSAYRRRLSDLREELEDARGAGNVERAEQAEQEIDALSRELSRAVGLGGRNRRAVSASERARQSIGKTVKAVLDRIAQSDAKLAELLARCIRTGNFCSYQPEPEFPIAWEFAAATVEPDQRPASSDDPNPAGADHPQAAQMVLEVSPFSLAERTAFVGRENEGSAIRTAIDRARAGHGSIVMLWDGPGVGKTRLAMQTAEYASSKGFRCSVGHCYERDESHPYLPFAEIIENNLAQAASLEEYRGRMGPYAAELAQIAPRLRRFFPDLPQPLELPAAQQRGFLFQSFSEAMARAARTRPTIYLLEDLHWADESTLALFMYLARRIAQLPAVIIGTYRSGYADINPALVRTLEELIRMGVRPQKLGGLSKDDVGQMLQGLSQREAPENLLNLIFEESQGYPFFVEEVYRHLVEEGKVFDTDGKFRKDIKTDEIEVPDNVRLIISRRLERFDENEKLALTAAAVIGRSFSFRLLTEVSRVDVDDLFNVIEKAQRMGIIVPSSEGPEKPFTFRHELVRQTLLADISAPRQQQLHAGVADAIERLNPDAVNERAGEIADHLLKAGSFADVRRLVSYLTIAGKSSLGAAAFEEARRSFQSALAHRGEVDPRPRAELLASLAMAEHGLNQWGAGEANLGEALEIYIELDDREMVGRTFTELTDAFVRTAHFARAIETARRGLAYLEADRSANRVLLLAPLAQAHAATGAYQPAEEALREALNIASELSDPKLEARLHGARSTVNLQFFRLSEAVHDGLLSEELGGPETPPWQRSLQMRGLHQALLYLGRLEEALKIVDLLEPLARKIGDKFTTARCISTRAWTEFCKAPHLAKLEAGLEQESKSGREDAGIWDSIFSAQLSQLHFFRGDWAGALLAAQASRSFERGSVIEGNGVGTLFRQMAYAGDRDGALAILDEKRALMPRSGQPNAAGSWSMLALFIESLVMLGEQAQAGQLYPLACELIGTGTVVLWPSTRLTQTIAGIAAAAAREWGAAEEHFQIAMQQAESLPNRLEQADIRRFHAMMLVDRAAPGDRDKAQTLLNEAQQSYTRIGMPPHVEMTRALLGQATGA